MNSGDEELLRWLDGRLDEATEARVEALLRSDPEIAGRLLHLAESEAELREVMALRRQGSGAPDLRVFGAETRNSRRTLFAVALCAAALLFCAAGVALLYSSTPNRETPQTTNASAPEKPAKASAPSSWGRILTQEGASVIRNAGTPIISRPGFELETGDRLSVPEGGRSEVALDAGRTKLRLNEFSALELREEQGTRQLHLVSGSLHAEVARQEPGKGLIFATPDAHAEILGTRFSLALEPEGTRLEVEEGSIRFRNLHTGETHAVVAGYAAHAAKAQLRVEAAPAILFCDGFEDLEAWRRTPLPNRQLLVPMAERRLVRGGTQSLLLRYRLPEGLAELSPSEFRQKSYCYLARDIHIPAESTHLECWVRVRSAQESATLVVMALAGDVRWRWEAELRPLQQGWQRLRFAFSEAGFWRLETGVLRPPVAPPPDPEVVTHLALGGVAGDFDLCMDDLSFVRLK